MRCWAGLAAVCAALLAAGCATEPTEVASAADEGAIRCRDEMVAGTNVIQTLCMTESDWDEYRSERRKRSQDLVRRMQGLGGGY